MVWLQGRPVRKLQFAGAEASGRDHMERASQALGKVHLMPAGFVPAAINLEEKHQFLASELSCSSVGISKSGGVSVPIVFLCHLKGEQLCHSLTSLTWGEMQE